MNLNPDPLYVEPDEDLPDPRRHITVPLVLACALVAVFVVLVALYGGSR